MTMDFANAIMDWRGTNGIVSLDYASLGYFRKNAPFETVDELRLVYGATVDLLAGDDINRNGVLDANEKDSSGNGQMNSGLFEYSTVYTREPNFHSDGTIADQREHGVAANDCKRCFKTPASATPATMAQSIYRSIHPAAGRT